MQYLTDADMVGERGCILSDCGTYRYRLWREWDSTRPTLAFLMLNPSTADHLADDPTVARCMARAIAGKFGRLDVVNLFPLRATDPDELLTHPDPVGPRNPADGAVMDAVEQAHTIICAWGAHPAAAPRAAELMHIFGIAGWRNRLMHLGLMDSVKQDVRTLSLSPPSLNKDGSPKHPLYIAASTWPKLFTWST